MTQPGSRASWRHAPGSTPPFRCAGQQRKAPTWYHSHSQKLLSFLCEHHRYYCWCCAALFELEEGCLLGVSDGASG